MTVKLMIGIVLSITVFAAAASESDRLAREDNVQRISATIAPSYDQAARITSDILIKEVARQHAIDLAMAPIRSRADLDQYMVSHRLVASPLDVLSPGLHQIFVSV